MRTDIVGLLKEQGRRFLSWILTPLAHAIGRKKHVTDTAGKLSKLSSIASKWRGKFELPEADPDDPRMDYLVKKYWRHRK